jgi:hypothetical protein
MRSIIVIGAGWYGCHIANILNNGSNNIIMLEKNSDIFNNSSYFNQNRLHLGYHYCRNFSTRNMCKTYYDSFIKKYSELIDNIDNNYYLISNKSIIDFNTFLSIYNYEQFSFELVNNTLFDNIDGKLIKVNEQIINSDKVYKYFKDKLKDIPIYFNETVNSYKKNNDKITVYTNNTTYECELLLDCTYNQLQLSTLNYSYELTCSLIYKKIKETAFDAITIMDGKFSSLYPRDINNLIYTLTDVEFTPIISSNNFNDILNYNVTDEKIQEIKYNMTTKLKEYYPNFEEEFEYIDYFLAKKTKQISNSDSRDIIIEELEKNVITVNCGKIYGIFDFENFIINYINI